jgi:hypothetical protein
MSYPSKTERNIGIVNKRAEGMSWPKIAQFYGLSSHGTVRKIYHREVERLIHSKGAKGARQVRKVTV